MASPQRKQHHNSFLEQAILKTLLYSDLFHFPLTVDELWKYLASKKKVTRKEFENSLTAMKKSSDILYKDGYYALPNQEAIIKQRKKYLPELEKKQAIAQKAATYLSYIPTILFIGLSGGVAVGNVTPDDDIDFFIITKRRTLFLTRLWILAMLEWLKLRRKRNDLEPANKICVNLLIEENATSWPSRKRDLYTAHEIVQIQPLFERNTMYMKFLLANRWINTFLPNAFSLISQHNTLKERQYYSLSILSFFLTWYPFELIMRGIQKAVIKKHRSRETVLNSFLAFHPFDYRTKTLAKLREKSQVLGLLTKE